MLNRVSINKNDLETTKYSMLESIDKFIQSLNESQLETLAGILRITQNNNFYRNWKNNKKNPTAQSNFASYLYRTIAEKLESKEIKSGKEFDTLEPLNLYIDQSVELITTLSGLTNTLTEQIENAKELIRQTLKRTDINDLMPLIISWDINVSMDQYLPKFFEVLMEKLDKGEDVKIDHKKGFDDLIALIEKYKMLMEISKSVNTPAETQLDLPSDVKMQQNKSDDGVKDTTNGQNVHTEKQSNSPRSNSSKPFEQTNQVEIENSNFPVDSVDVAFELLNEDDETQNVIKDKIEKRINSDEIFNIKREEFLENQFECSDSEIEEYEEKRREEQKQRELRLAKEQKAQEERYQEEEKNRVERLKQNLEAQRLEQERLKKEKIEQERAIRRAKRIKREKKFRELLEREKAELSSNPELPPSQNLDDIGQKTQVDIVNEDVKVAQSNNGTLPSVEDKNKKDKFLPLSPNVDLVVSQSVMVEKDYYHDNIRNLEELYLEIKLTEEMGRATFETLIDFNQHMILKINKYINVAQKIIANNTERLDDLKSSLNENQDLNQKIEAIKKENEHYENLIIAESNIIIENYFSPIAYDFFNRIVNDLKELLSGLSKQIKKVNKEVITTLQKDLETLEKFNPDKATSDQILGFIEKLRNLDNISDVILGDKIKVWSEKVEKSKPVIVALEALYRRRLNEEEIMDQKFALQKTQEQNELFQAQQSRKLNPFYRIYDQLTPALKQKLVNFLQEEVSSDELQAKRLILGLGELWKHSNKYKITNDERIEIDDVLKDLILEDIDPEKYGIQQPYVRVNIKEENILPFLEVTLNEMKVHRPSFYHYQRLLNALDQSGSTRDDKQEIYNLINAYKINPNFSALSENEKLKHLEKAALEAYIYARATQGWKDSKLANELEKYIKDPNGLDFLQKYKNLEVPHTLKLTKSENFKAFVNKQIEQLKEVPKRIAIVDSKILFILQDGKKVPNQSLIKKLQYEYAEVHVVPSFSTGFSNDDFTIADDDLKKCGFSIPVHLHGFHQQSSKTTYYPTVIRDIKDSNSTREVEFSVFTDEHKRYSVFANDGKRYNDKAIKKSYEESIKEITNIYTVNGEKNIATKETNEFMGSYYTKKDLGYNESLAEALKNFIAKREFEAVNKKDSSCHFFKSRETSTALEIRAAKKLLKASINRERTYTFSSNELTALLAHDRDLSKIILFYKDKLPACFNRAVAAEQRHRELTAGRYVK